MPSSLGGTVAVNTVERSLGLKYPDTPEELVVFVQRVLGPMVAQLKTRFNVIGVQVGLTIEETETDLAALDTADMHDAFLGIASDTRGLFTLDIVGVVGVGDLAATPTGRWKFIQTL